MTALRSYKGYKSSGLVKPVPSRERDELVEQALESASGKDFNYQ